MTAPFERPRVREVGYREILVRAGPIMLANTAAPLLGLADTAVLGHWGTTVELGALALGVLVFSFVYWTFGFLRMGTTGFVARAVGARDDEAVRVELARGTRLALLIGVGLVLLQRPILDGALAVLGASEAVERTAAGYLSTRIWGAPASLLGLVATGTLIGLGRSGDLLKVHVAMNAINVVLDVAFVVGLDWGARGIGWGTAIAEWAGAAYGIARVRSALLERGAAPLGIAALLRITGPWNVLATLQVHADIMLRTLMLLAGFGWFTERSARLGDATLAANHVLLQFVSFAAFFLDGYAFATESFVGEARGARSPGAFDAVVAKSTLLAAATALALAGIFALSAPLAIRGLTDLSSVRDVATEHVGFVVAYVVAAVWAFQLDGIFVGATASREMRNASIGATAIFVVTSLPLESSFGNRGLWIAFVVFACARALCLGAYLPRLRRSIA